jgi:hypothetical protein
MTVPHEMKGSPQARRTGELLLKNRKNKKEKKKNKRGEPF